MTEPRLRLIQARETAGFETATDAARHYGWAESTYLAKENGTRGITAKNASVYGKAFGVSPEWVLYGTNATLGVQVIGYVGAGAEVFSYDDYPRGDGLRVVEKPPNSDQNFVAVEVRGDSMYPAYQNGDVLYYSEHAHDKSQAQGRDCIVSLADGRKLVKRVEFTSDGVTLISHNAPPIYVDSIEWAAPVVWLKRR